MMTAEQVKEVIREMERDVKSKSKRKSMATFFAKNIAGKISEEGVQVYKEYVASL